MKKIFCFGDSWTLGMGSETEPGSGKISIDIKNSQKFREENKDYKYSYPGQLQEQLGSSYQVFNYGMGGGSNYNIYNMIINKLKSSEPVNPIKRGDIVIVGWTSVIREPLSFFKMIDDYNEGSIDFSLKSFEKGHDGWYPYWIRDIRPLELQKGAQSAFEDFIVNRINLNFMYEQVMNYICHLQIIFESMGIDYIFFNAFENVVSKKIHFHNQIKKENWILFDYTLSDYLCDIEPTIDKSLTYSVWEDDIKKNERNNDGPHPNRLGYCYIKDLVHKKIKEKICLI